MKKTVAFLLALILMLTNLGAVLAETISAPPADQISATSGFASVEKKFFSTRETAAKGAPSIILVRASIKKAVLLPFLHHVLRVFFAVRILYASRKSA